MLRLETPPIEYDLDRRRRRGAIGSFDHLHRTLSPMQTTYPSTVFMSGFAAFPLPPVRSFGHAAALHMIGAERVKLSDSRHQRLMIRQLRDEKEVSGWVLEGFDCAIPGCAWVVFSRIMGVLNRTGNPSSLRMGSI